MDRQTYSKAYNESKQQLKDAIRRFEQENPERFAELQAQAKYETEHPPERQITHYQLPTRKLDVETLLSQFHKGRKDYYIRTKDMFGDEHLYFHTLTSPEQALEVMTQRHPKFTERNERIIEIEPCKCPLCLQTK